MTRIAPLLTLASVAVLGAGLFATNHLATPAAAPPVPLAAAGAVPEAVGAAPQPAAPPAPADAPAAAGTAYAGWTAGMGLTVAMTVVGDEVVAYVCDGEQVEVWLRGTADDGVLDLTHAGGGAGGATLTGTVDDSWAEGAVTIDGERRTFTAEPIEAAAAAAAGRGDVAEVAERAGMDY